MKREGLNSFLKASELPQSAALARGLRTQLPPKGESTDLTVGPEALLRQNNLEVSPLESRVRNAMTGMLETSPQSEANRVPILPSAAPSHPLLQQKPSVPGILASYISSFSTLKSRILEDLEAHLGELLKLNISRRDAVAQHLERLAQCEPMTSAATAAGNSAGTALRRWIEGPRSRAQNAALHCYFEEIALISLGQTVLLKAWADRGLRAWSEADLKDLNWAMNTALKPHIPLDRETWQVASRNIYSWYKLSPSIQKDIWNVVDPWKLGAEGPTFLASLLSATRKAQAEFSTAESSGYDSRFFETLWSKMPSYGLNLAAAPAGNSGMIRKTWTAFTPTLRDGQIVRTGPVSLSWIGLDSSPFQLMVAELLQLWWGQAAPPLWAIGNGLEVPTRDQLILNLGSPKQSLSLRIAEMEACDTAFVFEERSIRGQARTPESHQFREQVDSTPYFRKLRAAGTTLGDLQACVAISKLRPGGLLWWAREEALGESDGRELLNFLLERGKLVCEWDLSEVEHSLPALSRPLFPKYLYLFAREAQVEQRLEHRPMRLSLSGQIRSHVEIPLFLEDALQAGATGQNAAPRGPWKIGSQVSPVPQREWTERWPDPASQITMRRLERLRELSLALASATTVRPTPDGDPTRGGAWCVDSSLRGFWIQALAPAKPAPTGGPVADAVCSLEIPTQGRRLVARPLPHPGSEAQGSGFLVLVADQNSVAPLQQYLESDLVGQWLEHHCERKGDRWILNEQIVRWIPVPRPLLRSLGLSSAVGEAPGVDVSDTSQFALPLPGDWERLASQLSTHPSAVRDAVQKLRGRPSGAGDSQVLAEIFVRAARTLESAKSSQRSLLSVVTPEGRVRWQELLRILPHSETTSVTLHPMVTVQGSLPLHLPIVRISPIKMPAPGFMLATEAGLFIKLLTDSPRVYDMIADQMDGLQSPTWSELLQYLKLPRRLEVAEAAANDVLRAHGEQTGRIRELVELMGECTLF